jgi:hypothetical protein
VLRRLLAWVFRDKQEPYDDVVAHREAVVAAGGEPTHRVVLRLDPAAMEDADLEVRWDIEKALRAVHPDVLFYDDGYGFARHSDAMLLSYGTNEPDRLVEALVDVLTSKITANEFATAAMIAIGPRGEPSGPGQEFANHHVVYPHHEVGKPLPDLGRGTSRARAASPWPPSRAT